MEEFLGVPVGEAEAAGGAGGGDIGGFWGAVDAVAREGQAHPGQADRVIGAGGDDHFFIDSFLQGDIDEKIRTESVIGIGGSVFDAEFAIGSFVFVAGDGAGEAGLDLAVAVSEEGGIGEEDDDPVNFRQGAGVVEVGGGQEGSGINVF